MTVQGLLGKKIGMTTRFSETGEVEAVTVIKMGPCTVTQVKSADKDGYDSVQLGFEPVRSLNRPRAGHLKQAGKLFRHLREVKADESSELQVGQEIKVSIFEPGERVDAIGTSRGRGFAGVVKRHHFKGGPKTHGQSDRQRAPGAIGSTTFPGRVLKGLRMAGHMGNQRVTVRNLEVVQADPERDLLLLKGAVPGPRDSLVIIRKVRS
jgi:large subunit ribosomal protein L3